MGEETGCVRQRLRLLLQPFRRAFYACLPREWALRLRRRAIEQHFRPLLEKAAKGVDRDYLKEQRWEALQTLEEFFEDTFTQRLLRKARRYYVLPPPRPDFFNNDDPNLEYWASGVTDTPYLTPAGVHLVVKQIDEERARRRVRWESWAKILGGILPGLVALGSVIVSLFLVFRR